MLWTAFMLGLAGSLHCAGMCGPLALALPAPGGGRVSHGVGRLAYNLGRLVTYGVLGFVFGLIGKSFAVIGAQRWISIAAGGAILLGLFASPKRAWTAPIAGMVASVKAALASVLKRRTTAALFLVGGLNGLLPCGLVYVACAGAATTGDWRTGIEYMLLFGVGTLPMMLAISVVGATLRAPLRIRFQSFIPASLAILAAWFIVRGLSLGIPYLSPDLAGASGVQPIGH